MEITWQTPPHASQKQDYVLYSGKSHVLPYYFEFVSHVNKRWEGKTIVDLFSQDFRGRSRDIMLVLSNVDGYKWMERMYLFPTLLNDPRRLATSYTVMGWDVEILQSEPDVLTVCEPASVPREGTFFSSCHMMYIRVINIVKTQFWVFSKQSMGWRLSIHRLDHLVSGLLIMAKNPAMLTFLDSINSMLQRFLECFRRVSDFLFQQVVDSNVDYNAREGRSTAELGICNGDTTLKGKAACTKFTRISTNGTHSIVLCEPVTGRTHQISVHLQCMGHPIANDMLYLSDNVVDRCTLGTTANIAAALSGSSPETSCENHNEEYKYCNEDFSIDPMCTHCPNLAPDGFPRVF